MFVPETEVTRKFRSGAAKGGEQPLLTCSPPSRPAVWALAAGMRRPWVGCLQEPPGGCFPRFRLRQLLPWRPQHKPKWLSPGCCGPAEGGPGGTCPAPPPHPTPGSGAWPPSEYRATGHAEGRGDRRPRRRHCCKPSLSREVSASSACSPRAFKDGKYSQSLVADTALTC